MVLDQDVAVERSLEALAVDFVVRVLEHEREAHPVVTVAFEAFDVLGVERAGLGAGVELGLDASADGEDGHALDPADDPLGLVGWRVVGRSTRERTSEQKRRDEEQPADEPLRGERSGGEHVDLWMPRGGAALILTERWGRDGVGGPRVATMGQRAPAVASSPDRGPAPGWRGDRSVASRALDLRMCIASQPGGDPRRGARGNPKLPSRGAAPWIALRVAMVAVLTVAIAGVPSASAVSTASATETEAPPPTAEAPPDAPLDALELLGESVARGTLRRLDWHSSANQTGVQAGAPVLVVHGTKPGPVLCLSSAVHGDELNGIEIVRRIVYSTDPADLKGTLIGVPIVNLSGFQRASRYLSDRRDLNRYFPGNPAGSLASRVAYSYFNSIVRKCDRLVDLHTGSFHRSNLPQLRADLANDDVLEMTHGFGNISVLHSTGGEGTLRRAAAQAGIPAVTIEAGEPLRLQEDAVLEGVEAIESYMAHLEMISRIRVFGAPQPVYYESTWVRSNRGGILLSDVQLGESVELGQTLGRVIDPVDQRAGVAQRALRWSRARDGAQPGRAAGLRGVPDWGGQAGGAAPRRGDRAGGPGQRRRRRRRGPGGADPRGTRGAGESRSLNAAPASARARESGDADRERRWNTRLGDHRHLGLPERDRRSPARRVGEGRLRLEGDVRGPGSDRVEDEARDGSTGDAFDVAEGDEAAVGGAGASSDDADRRGTAQLRIVPVAGVPVDAAQA